MKILFSEIKKLIPDLKVNPKAIGEALTSSGFMMDGFEEIEYSSKKDYLLSFEVRQNRVDCFSVIGLAKEVAAYYGLKIKLPIVPKLVFPENKLDIKVAVPKYVKRILAIRIKGLKNKRSPGWLREYMAFHDINSANLLVDLSNCVMFLTSYPSHLIDLNKVQGQISWAMNRNFKEMVTLGGSKIPLNKDELIIQDEKNIIALAGIVGSRAAEIDSKTTEIVAETAIYDRSIIRKNSRSLKIITEASTRLGKDLDPNGLEFAEKLLISMILKYCGGKIDSQFFDYYPQRRIPPKIKFDPNLPSIFAGVEIPENKVIKILKNLNFEVKKIGKNLLVVPPQGRMDISLPEDLIEEVIRIFGYNKIPSNEIPKLEIVENITPQNIYLGEKIRDILSTLGFDEILSWPLTKKGDNEMVNYLDWNIVSTQNSVNEDYPDLKQSMAVGLVNQLQEYLKKNVEHIKIFEIGKVFGERGNNYEEHEAVGILIHTFFKEKKLSIIKETTEKLLRLIGLADISYMESKNKPQIANSYSCWDIVVEEKVIGILYKLKPQKSNQNTYFAEFNLDEIVKLLEKIQNKPVVELTQKLIVLDANVELQKGETINDFLAEIKKKIKSENIWSIEIIDEFSLKEKIRYTIRVFYKELSDQEAKKIHLKIFNLQ